jgi:integrase
MSVIYSLSGKEKGGQSEILILWKNSKTQERAKSGVWVKSDWYKFVIGKETNTPQTGKKTITNEMKGVEQYHREKKIQLMNLVKYIDTCSQNIDKEKGWVKDSIDKYYQRGRHKKITLLTFVADFVAQLTNKTKNNNKSYSQKTIADYRVFNERLNEFVQFEKKTDVEFTEIDNTFADNFNAYLTNKGYCYNTVGKYMKTLRTILIAAKDKGIMTTNVKIKNMSEEVYDVYLNEIELKKIATLDLNSSSVLTRCRDYFLILCYSGVRISDLETVLNTPIVDNTVTFHQKKTDQQVVAPILPEIKNLVELYENQKVIKNSNFNDYIRKICQKAGIDEVIATSKTVGKQRLTEKHQKWELVSTHTGRRSFATNSHKRGIPSITIMSVTGHRTESAFLRYIKASANEHANILLKAWTDEK